MDSNNQAAAGNTQGKVKKPLYKKWWFWVVIAILVIGIIGSNTEDSEKSGGNAGSSGESGAIEAGNTENSEEETITYVHYNVTELFDEIDSNALRAEQNHKGEYVEIEGYVHTIDSSGKYISVGAEEHNYDYLFDTIHCTVKNREQKDRITELNKYDKIVVRGKITTVGEVLGYYLDIASIE